MRIQFFFFNDTSTTEIYTLSLHDALPIYIELGKDNIDTSNEAISGMQFNDIVTFESNRSRDLECLHDGDHDSYWNAGSEEAYLQMSLPSPMKILGIRFVLKSSFYALGQMNVYAKESKGFMSYGRVERDTKGKDLYVRFKEPKIGRAHV